MDIWTILPNNYDGKYSHSRSVNNLVIDGLEFSNDLDEYLKYYLHIRSYEDLISKPGYQFPKDIIEKFIVTFWPIVKNQINFIKSYLPRQFVCQITDVWSVITVIRLAMIEFNYGPLTKKRLLACLGLYEIYHRLIELHFKLLSVPLSVGILRKL